MNAPSNDLENSVQLALEAAAAANDATDDMAGVCMDTKAAAARLDQFTTMMKPLFLGIALGMVVSVLLGAMIYLRTLSEMRDVTATQIEALSRFTSSVGKVEEQMTTLQDVQNRLDQLETTQAQAMTQMQTALSAELTNIATGLTAQTAGTPDEQMLSQMLGSLSKAIQDNHKTTQETVISGLSDLQLALTRMLANRPVENVQAQPRATPSGSTAKPVHKTSAPVVAPNPFKYP